MPRSIADRPQEGVGSYPAARYPALLVSIPRTSVPSQLFATKTPSSQHPTLSPEHSCSSHRSSYGHELSRERLHARRLHTRIWSIPVGFALNRRTPCHREGQCYCFKPRFTGHRTNLHPPGSRRSFQRRCKSHCYSSTVKLDLRANLQTETNRPPTLSRSSQDSQLQRCTYLDRMCPSQACNDIRQELVNLSKVRVRFGSGSRLQLGLLEKWQLVPMDTA